MVNAPTLLGLPLETRQHIYSHHLLNPHPLDMIKDDMHHLPRSLLLTNHQLNREVSTFYYAKNTFTISLISANYNAKERGRKTLLEKHLACVKNLCLVIRTSEEQRRAAAIGDAHVFFSTISQFPKQQKQWYWFVDALARVKGGRDGMWLTVLEIRDSGLDAGVRQWQPLMVLGEVGSEVVAPYSFLLERVRGRIGRVEVQQMTEAQEVELEADGSTLPENPM